MVKIKLLLILLLFTGCVRERLEIPPAKEADSSAHKETYLSASFKGYILNIYNINAKPEISADSIEWLSDDEAEKTFAADKKEGISGIDDLENGIYIRNVKKDSIVFGLAGDCRITMQTYSRKKSGEYNFNEVITVSQFLSFISTHPEVIKVTPFSFTVVEGKAVQITEIYIP